MMDENHTKIPYMLMSMKHVEKALERQAHYLLLEGYLHFSFVGTLSLEIRFKLV